jgi:hypothetical protein
MAADVPWGFFLLKNPFTLSAGPDLLEAPRNAEKSAGLHPLRTINWLVQFPA